MPSLLPPTPIIEVANEETADHIVEAGGGEYDSGAEGILGGRIIVEEPEDMGVIDDEHIREDSDSTADDGDDSSSEDGRHPSFKSARSHNACMRRLFSAS